MTDRDDFKQINSLEKSLNLQLFDRTHRGLTITPAGESLYQDTKYIIQSQNITWMISDSFLPRCLEYLRIWKMSSW